MITGEITLIDLFIAHRYNNDVKHIKILTKDCCFYIAEKREGERERKRGRERGKERERGGRGERD